MTATFTTAPDFASSKASQPRVLEATFGDGYVQRSVDGINSNMATWSLTFNARDTATIDAIEAFLEANIAMAFNWTPPGSPSSTSVTAESFGTGDGSTTTFTLKKDGLAVRNVTASPLIYDNAVLDTITTDYTLDLVNGTVTFVTAPLTGHPLTWTGSFTPTYLFTCASWKRTPVEYGIDSLTATFKQVLG